MHHSTSAAEETVNALSKVFSDQMRFLETQGYGTISLQALTDKELDGKLVVITFNL